MMHEHTTTIGSALPRKTATVDQRLAAVEMQLSLISAQLDKIVDAQQPMVDLRRELEPITREMMDASIAHLAHLEARGYFDFARELVYLVDRIVEDYSPEDLHQLADHAANILDTVRELTQPSVMAVARDVAKAFEEERHPKPQGLWGAWRRIRKEKNVRRGIGFALDLLGRVGRAVSRAPRFSRAAGGAAAEPARLAPPRPASRGNGAPAKKTSASPAPPEQLVFVADDAWSRDYASAIAESMGMAQLEDGHWQLIEFARDDYKKSGSAPNIRRITTQTGVSTSRVYELFPRAPGLTISRLAGIPKPAGCL